MTKKENKTGRPMVSSEERYKAFIENIDDGVYEVDLQGNFTYFNNSLCKVFGYPREDIQGRNFSKFMDENRARAAFDIFNQIYLTGKGISDLLWETIDKEGNTRSVELSANLITDSAGEKVGFRGIARDVTARVKAQSALVESESLLQGALEASRLAEKRYKTLLDFLPYPLVVFNLDGTVSYLNPAFTEIFGWSLEELYGKRIPYVPAEHEEETRENIERLIRDKVILHHESKRLTKDGKTVDVLMRGVLFTEQGSEPAGEIVLLRDISHEKRQARISEAMLHISTALPAYPDLEDLLDYVSEEIRKALDVEGALVILLDREKNELFFLGAAYDDRATEQRAKEIRYPADKGVSGKVIKTGEPVIVHDTYNDPDFYRVVDQRLGYRSRSMLDVPMRSGDRIVGVLCAINKKGGAFDQDDVEILSMIAATVAPSIENARFSRELRRAYKEVSSLNRAKDRMINRLSHELKTPLSVLMASLNILSNRLAALPEESWKATIERSRRNLDRILGIQYQAEDIMEGKPYKSYALLNHLLDQCEDQLEAFAAEKAGEGAIVDFIRGRIQEIYGPRESKISEIPLQDFVKERLEILRPSFHHRQVEIETRLEDAPKVRLPEEVLRKVFDGLVRNAVEATPDEGKVEVVVQKRGGGAELVVTDHGIGITEENQGRIFEGFFTTQETMAYSSKRPFDFNAGGKGADLLRMKIFSERYGFRIGMVSARCPHLPKDSDRCAGVISRCSFCRAKEDCTRSGGTSFSVYFPASVISEKGEGA
ncbi:MAG: PAS domain S-box protein [Desulfobacteraceae bacterium]|nr:MAG: PAS domain S-box protein [Desulfobacteraceae bacterium]